MSVRSATFFPSYVGVCGSTETPDLPNVTGSRVKRTTTYPETLGVKEEIFYLCNGMDGVLVILLIHSSTRTLPKDSISSQTTTTAVPVTKDPWRQRDRRGVGPTTDEKGGVEGYRRASSRTLGPLDRKDGQPPVSRTRRWGAVEGYGYRGVR